MACYFQTRLSSRDYHLSCCNLHSNKQTVFFGPRGRNCFDTDCQKVNLRTFHFCTTFKWSLMEREITCLHLWRIFSVCVSLAYEQDKHCVPTFSKYRGQSMCSICVIQVEERKQNLATCTLSDISLSHHTMPLKP